jgi:hypothetical protein
MSSIEIEEDLARTLAGELFDNIVAPLAASRRDSAKPTYFPLAGETGAATYYEKPLLHVMQPADFEFPGGGSAQGLVEALAALWKSQGETGLAAMTPKLAKIAEVLQAEADAGDGSVSILCYTMF